MQPSKGSHGGKQVRIFIKYSHLLNYCSVSQSMKLQHLTSIGSTPRFHNVTYAHGKNQLLYNLSSASVYPAQWTANFELGMGREVTTINWYYSYLFRLERCIGEMCERHLKESYGETLRIFHPTSKHALTRYVPWIKTTSEGLTSGRSSALKAEKAWLDLQKQ